MSKQNELKTTSNLTWESYIKAIRDLFDNPDDLLPHLLNTRDELIKDLLPGDDMRFVRKGLGVKDE